MQKAIEILMDEHRAIERVLGALDTYARQVRSGLPLERRQVARFASFFSEVADARHHGKEEDILFRAMIENGFPRDGGPIAVMLAEHVQGRQYVGVLRSVGAGTDSVSEADRSAFSAACGTYVPLLIQHIQKEDQILYPMAENVITGAQFAALTEEFERFELRLAGADLIVPFQRLAETLTGDFPPNLEQLAAAKALGGCGFRRG